MRLPIRPALAVFAVLALAMAVTRVHHFGALPDASWAVFFAAGAWLGGHLRWAFPGLMALAVLIDYLVITASGLSFWQHYCVSPAYWLLLPAHAAMTLAGRFALARGGRPSLPLLGRSIFALALGIVLCHGLAQGGFYWLSGVVAEPTLAGWWSNFSDWLPAYAAATAAYAGLAALAHLLVWQLRGLPRPRQPQAG